MQKIMQEQECNQFEQNKNKTHYNLSYQETGMFRRRLITTLLLLTASASLLHAEIVKTDYGSFDSNNPVPPELREAMEYYNEWKTCEREKAVRLFQKYLDRYPNHIFRAEVYHIISNLYGPHCNKRLDEKPIKKKIDYYTKRACQIYGDAICTENLCEQSTLAMAGDTVESHVNYYKWLLYIQYEATREDLFPATTVGALLKHESLPVLLTEEQKENQLKGTKRIARQNLLPVARKNAFAALPPGQKLTYLKTIKKLHEQYEAEAKARSQPATRPSPATKPSRDPGTKPVADNANPAKQRNGKSPADSHTGLYLLVAVLVFTAIAATAAAFLRRGKNENE